MEQPPAIDADDIARLEQVYNAELLSGRGVAAQTKFEYAWALAQSRYKKDIEKGVELLLDLHRSEPQSRDYIYYLAVGQFRKGDYENARATIEKLLAIEPANRQALALVEQIESAVYKGTLVSWLCGALAIFAPSLVLACCSSRPRLCATVRPVVCPPRISLLSQALRATAAREPSRLHSIFPHVSWQRIAIRRAHIHLFPDTLCAECRRADRHGAYWGPVWSGHVAGGGRRHRRFFHAQIDGLMPCCCVVALLLGVNKEVVRHVPVTALKATSAIALWKCVLGCHPSKTNRIGSTCESGRIWCQTRTAHAVHY